MLAKLENESHLVFEMVAHETLKAGGIVGARSNSLPISSVSAEMQ
jgi:hypothetical protein